MAHLQATRAFVKKLAEEGRFVGRNPLVTGVVSSFHNALFDYRRFNQYGLLEDDTLKETPVVKEALRRLPRDVYQERQFRFARALEISSKQKCLPKEEWTNLENDLSYLKTYVAEVTREEQEKEDWENGNVKI